MLVRGVSMGVRHRNSKLDPPLSGVSRWYNFDWPGSDGAGWLQVDCASKKGLPVEEGKAAPQGVIEQTLGGTMADQIFCRADRSHRSEREEALIFMPVDIRNKSGLLESLARPLRPPCTSLSEGEGGVSLAFSLIPPHFDCSFSFLFLLLTVQGRACAPRVPPIAACPEQRRWRSSAFAVPPSARLEITPWAAGPRGVGPRGKAQGGSARGGRAGLVRARGAAGGGQRLGVQRLLSAHGQADEGGRREAAGL